MNLEQIGENCTRLIKRASWFPVRSRWLRNHATLGGMITDDTYCITFSNEIAKENPNGNGSEYITFLEEGTKPHDIPKAFGKELPFGIGGRFDGKFHPGSSKHKGFIKDKSVNAIINYIKTKYNGELR